MVWSGVWPAVDAAEWRWLLLLLLLLQPFKAISYARTLYLVDERLHGAFEILNNDAHTVVRYNSFRNLILDQSFGLLLARLFNY